jgi:HAD superfamily hydrolase (TIGR01549 family)
MAYKSQRLNGNPQNIRLFTTDWSGVISDDRRPVYEANMKVLEAHGKTRMTFQEWLPRTTLTPIEFFANHGLNGDPKILFEEYRDAYSESRRKGLNPIVYSDAKETLKFIFDSGVPVVVVSSHPKEHLIKEASEYGVSEYVLTFAGNTQDKTDGILKACSETGKEKTMTVYLGDTIYDIQAAKKAGVHSVGIATGYHVKERLINEDPDFCFESLSEFRNEMSSLLRR